MAKKKDSENVENTSVDYFSKEQLVKSKKYEDKVDVLNVILNDEKSYSIDEVDTMIDEFLKEEVL